MINFFSTPHPKLRVLFIGSSRLGLECLEKVAATPRVTIVGAVTNPETFSISYRPSGVKNVNFVDFQPFCESKNIPLYRMEGKMSDPGVFEFIQERDPEIIFVVGWYHMIPKAILDYAPCIGVHASLLPKYSGGAPLVWAMIRGEKKAGISAFVMDKGVDSGPLLGQREEFILEEDDISTLKYRIELKAVELVGEVTKSILEGNAILSPQNESERTLVPQRSPEDGKIEWSQSAEEIYNFVRAQTLPYPGAFAYFNGQKVIFWKVHKLKSTTKFNFSVTPGKLYRIDNQILVASGSDFIKPQSIEFKNIKGDLETLISHNLLPEDGQFD